jgi:hypothetical protein
MDPTTWLKPTAQIRTCMGTGAWALVHGPDHLAKTHRPNPHTQIRTPKSARPNPHAQIRTPKSARPNPHAQIRPAAYRSPFRFDLDRELFVCSSVSLYLGCQLLEQS